MSRLGGPGMRASGSGLTVAAGPQDGSGRESLAIMNLVDLVADQQLWAANK